MQGGEQIRTDDASWQITTAELWSCSQPTRRTDLNAGREGSPRDTSSANDASGQGRAEKDVAAAEKALDHAWRYFALHAQQRISVFNFFVVLSGILATAIGGGLQGGKAMSPVVSMLGGLLVLIAFVFWKLDRRGSHLIKLSESALRACEVACMPEYARIFVQEEGTLPPIAGAGHGGGRSAWTFGTSFRLIFVVMGGVGALASVFSVSRWLADVATKAA